MQDDLTPVERVERAFMVLEERQSPRGAQVWLARRLGRDRSIVHRYLTGAVTMDPEVEAEILKAEEEAAEKLDRQAERLRNHAR